MKQNLCISTLLWRTRLWWVIKFVQVQVPCTFTESTNSILKNNQNTTQNHSKLKKQSNTFPGVQTVCSKCLVSVAEHIQVSQKIQAVKCSPQDFPQSQNSNYWELYRPKPTQWITHRNELGITEHHRKHCTRLQTWNPILHWSFLSGVQVREAERWVNSRHSCSSAKKLLRSAW